MQTFEKHLRDHARRLECHVPEATAAGLLQRLEQEPSSLTMNRGSRWASVPLAAAAALTIMIVGSVAVITDDSSNPSSTAAETVVKNVAAPAFPSALSWPFEDVSQGVTQAESALLEEWGLIKSDLQRLRGSLDREWAYARKGPGSA